MFTEPRKAAEYRRNAAICLTMARDASESDRAVLIEIAHDWTAMAVECETQCGTPIPLAHGADVIAFPGPA